MFFILQFAFCILHFEIHHLGGLMNRTLSLLVITMLVFFAAACSDKKPPDPAAIQGKNVLSVLRAMSQFYETKNLNAFMSDVSANYRDRAAFSSSIAAVFSKYQTIHFNIQYTKMLIMTKEGGQIRTSFNWDAEWLGAKGTSQKNGGRVTLVFEPGKFKLVAIDGKNPFVPVENQGK
jgi:hypothetical protein